MAPPREGTLPGGKSGTLGIFSDLASPIAWRSFAAPTLDRAAADGRLLFLVIGASWCPYSQRLLRRLAHDIETQAVLHESYLPILVDGDDYPAIHARYSGGGWPSIAICSAAGWPIWRGTQIDPGDFPRLLRSLARDPGAGRPADPVGLVSEARVVPTVASFIERVMAAYHPASHGFALEPDGGGPRFPHFDVIELLLEAGDAAQRGVALAALRATLDGLWDPIDGGLRRYAAAPDWTEIHGEKLLIDQADLIATLALAIGHDPSFRADARKALDWSLASFGLADGTFSASLRPAHPEVPRSWPVAASDESLLVDANARMASALLSYGKGAGDHALVERAHALVDRLRALSGNGDSLPHRVHSGGSRVAAGLADYTSLASAVLDSLVARGCDQQRLRSPLQGLLDGTGRAPRFGSGAVPDVVADATAPGLLSRPLLPMRENAVLAEIASRVGRLDAVRDDSAREILRQIEPQARRAGLLAARYATALHRTGLRGSWTD